MKEFTTKLMDVEKDGLPEPDNNKLYFVIFDSGCGYGTFHYDIEYNKAGK